MARFSYSGVDQDGKAVDGAWDSDPRAFVRRMFIRGWRALVVTVGGREVGRIAPGVGERVRLAWWERADWFDEACEGPLASHHFTGCGRCIGCGKPEPVGAGS